MNEQYYQTKTIAQPATGFDCAVTTIEGPFRWDDVRRACDDALAHNRAFVLVLRDRFALAEDALLCDEDRQRATRFHRPQDRDNLRLGRTMVHYLVRPVGSAGPCMLAKGANGKPFIAGTPEFNLSHSDTYVACAISKTGMIGIDVETFSRLGDYRALIPAIAHPSERQAIEAAPPALQRTLFQRCWTRKEAVLKAAGIGLVDDLPGIDVQLAERSPIVTASGALRLVDIVCAESVDIALAVVPNVRGVDLYVA